MGVVPDIPSLPPGGYLEKWLDYEIPEIGAIYRLLESEPPCSGEKKLLCGREINAGPTDWLGDVRECLDHCRERHGGACRQQASHEPILRGFRLINCTKNPPVIEEKPWDTPYAALSYVWGTGPSDKTDWPTTVLDAVEVTKSLGLEYIWVDRSCINQSDPAEKSYLISRMTTIYEAAAFTIVAASGSGASHGLPGICQTPRRPQPKYFLDSGSILLSTLRDTRLDIIQSTYWTRGWTYQEAMLSNRHIVFTEDQIYWECRCMATYESIDTPVIEMNQSEDLNGPCVMIDFYLSGIFKDTAFSGRTETRANGEIEFEDQDYHMGYGFPIQEEVSDRDQLRGLNKHIREYSKRRLTYDTDTLLAFQGIVGMYEQVKSLYIFQGLPMWTGKVAGRAAGLQITFALSVSSWYHRCSSDQFMFVAEPCQRKTHLPSWTWAGWHGTVTWRAPPDAEHCAFMDDLIQSKTHNLLWTANISLFKPGSHRSINLLHERSAARLKDEMPTLLEIKNPLVLSTFKREVDTKKEWKWTRARGRPGRRENTGESPAWDEKWIRIGKRLSITGMSITMTEEEWTGKHASGELVSVLLFAAKHLSNEHGTARFLTLRRVSHVPERWERVGTLYLVIPFLGKTYSVNGMFTRIPTRPWHKSIIIQ